MNDTNQTQRYAVVFQPVNFRTGATQCERKPLGTITLSVTATDAEIIAALVAAHMLHESNAPGLEIGENFAGGILEVLRVAQGQRLMTLHPV